MTTEIELIAEMADALYTLVPTCFCHAKHCSKCENWERAKKLVDTAGVFAADLKTRRGSDSKKPPQGGSVNAPRPPQDNTPSKKKVCRFVYRGEGKPNPVPEEAFANSISWQAGPGAGGTMPPGSVEEVLVEWSNEFDILYRDGDELWMSQRRSPWEKRHWKLVDRWLILK